MTKGAYFEALDSYILVERLGQKIERIYFSREPPSERSVLAEQIIAYIEGRGSRPEVELDLSGFTEFQRKVIAAVQSIPRGQTLTYGEVALLAGRPGAARAVGQVMARNPFAILMPCHRVVSRQGLGGFGWGLDIKKKLLEIESC
jgi:methylated-DNA-[protein]-cysteine S-methyltransferase